MPNHQHGIIVIKETGTGETTKNNVTFQNPRAPTAENFGKPVAGSIPTIIRSFKSSTTLRFHRMTGSDQSLWQGNYYEHVIHNERDWEACRSYILSNPIHWEQDQEFSRL